METTDKIIAGNKGHVQLQGHNNLAVDAMPSKEKPDGSFDWSAYKYPFQNLSLEDMEGELWVPIPGLDECYEVSNKGRVRSNERMCFRHKNYFKKKAQILKLSVHKRKNSYANVYNYDLCCSISYNSTIHHFSVARLVYSAFIEPLADWDGYHAVMHRDGDNLNVLPENLYLATWKDVNHDMIVKGISPIKSKRTQHATWPRDVVEARVKLVRKPISQFDMQGSYITTFPSIREAAESVGIGASTICSVLKGNKKSAKNSLWRYGDDPSPWKEVPKRWKCVNVNRKTKKVAQYDPFGKLVRVYPSLKQASIKTGIYYTSLLRLIAGRRPRHGNHFRYIGDNEQAPEVLQIEA